MNNLKKMFVVCCTGFFSVAAFGAENMEKGLTFYASFDDGSAKAAFAKGDPNPTKISKPGELAAGIKGKGVMLDDEHLLEYSIPGNFDNVRGTISFCIKISQPPEKKSQIDLFREGKGGQRANYIGLSKWTDNGFFNRLFWILSDRPVSHQRQGSIQQKPVGEWHHILLTWDKDVDADFYIDGELILGDKYTVSPNSPRGGVTIRDAASYETMIFGPGRLAYKNLPPPDPGKTAKVVLDEVRIYDKMLPKEEAAVFYQRYFPINIKITGRSVFLQNAEAFTNFKIKNITGRQISFMLYPEICDDSGTNILHKGEAKQMTLEPEQEADASLPVKLAEPGDHIMRVVCEGEYVCSRNFWICALPEQKPQIAETDPKLQLELVKEFDCAKEYGKDEYCDDGMSKVVDSKPGKYRITSAETPFSRFAYRFFIDKPQTPHLAVVEYPDDREYQMEIMIDNRGNGTFQTVERGVIVGGHYPNLNKMNEIKFLFWPTSKECTIMAMNWPVGTGMAAYRGPEYGDRLGPAAMKAIKIYEVTGGVPAVKLANLPPADKQRTVGYQDEDASPSREYSANLLDMVNRFPETFCSFDRRFKHMAYVGQNLFVAPTIHYSGALYPSAVIQAADKSWQFPPYWHEMALRLAEQHGIKVQFNLLFLIIEVLDRMEEGVTLQDIIAGKETIRNMLWDGKPDITGSYGTGNPVFNILHPKVQGFILDVISELIEHYGDYPAFNGINLWGWSDSPLWISDLKTGYSDYNIQLFEKETGIKVSGEIPDPTRFTQRYVFLVRTDEATREKWIAWRCEKVKEFWMKICSLVQEKKPDLTITFDCWNIVTSYSSCPNHPAHIWEPGKPDSIIDYNRRGGLDFSMFKDIPNFLLGTVIMPNQNPNMERYLGRDFHSAPALIAAFRNNGKNAVWLEQDRLEFDNMHLATPMPDYWLPEDRVKGADDKAKKDMAPRGWLEKSGAIMPNGDYYLEYYAKYLADWDVREFTDGGITTTILGAEDVLRDFIRAYRTLPAEYFNVFKDVNDPVCVRHREDRFYAVNREFYPVKVNMTFSGDKRAEILDLAADRNLALKDGKLSFEIGPFRVRSFKMPAGVSLEDVNVIVPPEKTAWLKERYDTLLKNHAKLQAEKIFLPPNVEKDIPWFMDSLKKTWSEKHYYWLRKLLDSNWSQYIEWFSGKYKGGKLHSYFQAREYAEKYFSQAPRNYEINKVGAIPGIDSPEWEKQKPITDFSSVYLYEAGSCCLAKPPREKTVAYCAYDDKEIAFLFKCWDTEMEKVVPIKVRDDADLVKIMLAPNKAGKPYYYFRVHYDNANSYNVKINPGNSQAIYEFRNKLEYQATFKKEKDYWLGRIAIPFSTLAQQQAPPAGAVWRFNLVRKIRNNPRGDVLRCKKEYLPPEDWGFHDPTNYDCLVFSKVNNGKTK